MSGNTLYFLASSNQRADQLLHFFGMLVGQVMSFRTVLIGVEELPAVLVEVAHAAERSVLGNRLPALVPDPAAAQHLVVLGYPLVGAFASSNV